VRPAQPPTESESKVLRWLLIVAGVSCVIGIAVTWWSTSRECQRQCVAEGASRGVLHFRGGGRLNLGVDCRCESAPK
jgi:hypothetical protein